MWISWEDLGGTRKKAPEFPQFFRETSVSRRIAGKEFPAWKMDSGSARRKTTQIRRPARRRKAQRSHRTFP